MVEGLFWFYDAHAFSGSFALCTLNLHRYMLNLLNAGPLRPSLPSALGKHLALNLPCGNWRPFNEPGFPTTVFLVLALGEGENESCYGITST